jgi:hypothetical protein
MAKINFGGVVQDARGKQNGLVYSRNGYGSYVRRKVTPVNPKSVRQLAVRAAFAVNSKAWSGILTQAQRNQWIAFAAANPITDIFGLAITLSGIAMFNRMNQILANIGVAMITQAPVDLSVPALAAVIALTASHTGPTLTVGTASQSVVAGAEYYIFATGNQAPGVVPNQNQYRYIGAFAAAPSALQINIFNAWSAIFGALTVGKNIWCIVATVNTASGALTPPLKVQAVVA